MPESLVGPSWRLRHLRIPTTDRYTTPYRGFEAMEEKDSDYFFGRQRETVEVLALAGAPAACDRDRMASRWFPSLLALEISTSRRPATGIARGSRAYS